MDEEERQYTYTDCGAYTMTFEYGGDSVVVSASPKSCVIRIDHVEHVAQQLLNVAGSAAKVVDT